MAPVRKWVTFVVEDADATDDVVGVVEAVDVVEAVE